MRSGGDRKAEIASLRSRTENDYDQAILKQEQENRAIAAKQKELEGQHASLPGQARAGQLELDAKKKQLEGEEKRVEAGEKQAGLLHRFYQQSVEFLNEISAQYARNSAMWEYVEKYKQEYDRGQRLFQEMLLRVHAIGVNFAATVADSRVRVGASSPPGESNIGLGQPDYSAVLSAQQQVDARQQQSESAQGDLGAQKAQLKTQKEQFALAVDSHGTRAQLSAQDVGRQMAANEKSQKLGQQSVEEWQAKKAKALADIDKTPS
ncbi:MAG: hypothetical protein HY540_06825 [Deltaproteobacteria bacterium]|nr:hypothetical protein [Deltaproteobacteria bacterium]